MASFEIDNPDLDPVQFYTNQAVAIPPPVILPQPITGDVTVVTTINGNGGGQATGPTITISGGSTGYVFDANAGTVTLTISNPATVRSSIGAAASGVNTDITELNGASQVDVSSRYEVSGTQVVTAQQPAIPNASGGVTVDTEARAAINALLAALRTHGLIDT